MTKVLVIGASGRMGSKVVKELDRNSDGVEVILATAFPEEAKVWEKENRKSVVFDLNNPKEFPEALEGIDRVFLLTTYTSDMLFQAKTLVDAAKAAGVKHIVHLGVYTSRNDFVPHFTWHDLIESYIASSGMAWTNIHPNVVTESILVTNPPIEETLTFTSLVGDASQGWAMTDDIGAVAGTVLREGPDKHDKKNYYISTDVLTAKEVAQVLSDVSGKEIVPTYVSFDEMNKGNDQITSGPVRAYMESAEITMKQTIDGEFAPQNQLHDDVLTVTGRAGMTMKDWAEEYFKDKK